MIRHFKIAFVFVMMSLTSEAQIGLFEKPQRPQKIKEIENECQNRRDEKGRRQGDWMRFHPNGNIAYKARFKDDQPIDTLTRYYKSGKKFVEIVFEEKTNRGKGRFYTEEGKLIGEGFYLNMQKDSVWKFFDEKGRLRAKENYESDKRAGEARVFFNSGELASIVTYENDEKQGPEKRFYQGGQLRVYISYDKGTLNGPYDVYYQNGKKEIQGYYKNDKRDSTWVFFDATGNVKFSVQFEDGEPQNKEQLNAMQQEEFRIYEENRKRLKDPENYRATPEELMRGN
jgi:antitoxin component YwqK of YwqJK toxin-antitoxin module